MSRFLKRETETGRIGGENLGGMWPRQAGHTLAKKPLTAEESQVALGLPCCTVESPV